MKEAVSTKASSAVDEMFAQTSGEMLVSVGRLIDSLKGRTLAISDALGRKFAEIFSTCWERVSDDHALRAARDQAAGKLAPLRARLDAAMAAAGLSASAGPASSQVVDVL